MADITLPPSVVLTLRDTTPSQNPDQWLAAIPALEQRILALALRGRVRAAHEIEKVVDGLRIKALTQLPPFLLSLIRPLRSASKGLSTNLAVLQTSLLLKYQPFYTFLVRQSPRLARQVERGYVSAARSYYETGFRRYCRALASIKARTPERSEPLGYVSTEAAQAPASVMAEGIQQAYERLQFAPIDAEGQAGNVVLAYMADDKDFVNFSLPSQQWQADMMTDCTRRVSLSLIRPRTGRQRLGRVHIHRPVLHRSSCKVQNRTRYFAIRLAIRHYL